MDDESLIGTLTRILAVPSDYRPDVLTEVRAEVVRRGLREAASPAEEGSARRQTVAGGGRLTANLQWYWSHDGERRGPLSQEEFAASISSEEILPNDLVWHAGMVAWNLASHVPGAFVPPTDAGISRAGSVTVADPPTPRPPIAATAGAASAATSRRTNYFARHWRGELSLPVSYWINGFLANIATLGVITLLVSSTVALQTNYKVAIFWCAMWTAMAVAAVWQCVGVWRSAHRHVTATGRSGWARAAQVMVVLGLLRFATSFSSEGLPAIRKGFEHASWLGEHGRWNIRILRAGTEMEISGGIGIGMANDLDRLLRAAPAVRVVHVNLESGGLIDEAKRARDLIHARGLATYVSSSCVSACTLVFLGGKERYVKEDARLGFHTPSFPGLGAEQSEQLQRKEEGYLVSLGVSLRFASRVARTSPDQMWFPTREELLESGVVTAMTRGDEFAISGLPNVLDEDSVGVELQKSRIYRLLKAREPETYEKILRVTMDAVREGKSVPELRSVTAPLIALVCMKRLPLSSDAAVLRYGRLFVAQLHVLQEAPGSVCLNYAMRQGSGAVDAAVKYFPSDLATEELESMADVLESEEAARPGVSQAEHARLTERALAYAIQEAPEDISILASLDDPKTDPSQACRALHAVYSGILTLPEKDSATLLLWAQK